MPVNEDYIPDGVVQQLDEHPEYRQVVEQYAKMLGNDTRVKMIAGWLNGKNMNTVAEELDVSRPGLQKNVNKLVDGGFLYRPADDAVTYAATPLGQHSVEPGDHDWEDIVESYRIFDEAESAAREQISDNAEELGVPQRMQDRFVNTHAWETVWYDVKDLLDVGNMRYEPEKDAIDSSANTDSDGDNGTSRTEDSNLTEGAATIRASPVREEITTELYYKNNLRPSELYERITAFQDTSEENFYQNLGALRDANVVSRLKSGRRLSLYNLTGYGEAAVEELELIDEQDEFKRLAMHSSLDNEEIEELLEDITDSHR